MYRVLDRHQAVRERRSQLRHPEYKKPVLRATAPCQLWSWDITKLPTCEKWRYIHLYVILDVYSRAVVGWLASMTESAISAEKLIRETCEKEGIDRNQLTIHADRGAAMKSKAVSQLLADLGVEQSHSRPRVSNDNPFSESHFKTLKYSPEFPEKFSTVEGARSFLGGWFDWYNNHHRHSGIAMMTPAMVHQGQAPSVSLARQAVLENAFLDHPVRFGSKKPTPPVLPLEVWINNPTRQFSLVPA
jgi:putative transposase